MNITGLIEKNKNLTGQLDSVIQDILRKSETDFNNVVEINSHITSSLTQQEKQEINSILESIEIRIKIYDKDLISVQQRTDQMELETKSFVDGLGQQIRGQQLLQKNMLISATSEQITSIREGITTTKDILINLTTMIDDLREATGANIKQYEKIKSIAKKVLIDEWQAMKNDIIGSTPKGKDHSSDMQMLISKVNWLENVANDLKSSLEAMTNNFGEHLQKIEGTINTYKMNSLNYKDDLNALNNKLYDEFNELKWDFSSKMKHIERGLNDNALKRY